MIKETGKLESIYGSYPYTLYRNPGAEYGVVFAPGTMCFRTWYKWLGDLPGGPASVLVFSTPFKHLLSHNIYVWAEGIQRGADLLEDLGIKKILAAGHSMGATGALLAGSYPLVGAVVALAPGYPAERENTEDDDIMRESSYGCDVPTEIIVGTEDQFAKPYKLMMAQSHYEQLPGIKKLCVIDGGNHSQFLDPGLPSFISGLLDGEARIPHDEQLRITKNEILTWLREIQ